MNKIVDESYFDLIIDNNTAQSLKNGEKDSIFKINSRLSLLLINESQFNMCAMDTFPFASFPALFTLTSEISTNSNIDKVQSNPNLALFGQGVLVAIIDTGIDYHHKAFQYADGSTRILSLWDQTINENNTPPKGFYYGSEYNKDIINIALKSMNPSNIVPSVDEIGHGTMMAGIAGGSPDKSMEFSGVVPQCEFIIVKLKPAKNLNKKIFCIPNDKLCYEATDLISGLTYVTETAQSVKRPLAICIAMGTTQGGHDEVGPATSYVNYLSNSPQIGIAVSGGNEGNNRRHYFGDITQPYFHDFELNVSEKDPLFSFEIWSSTPYRMGLDITTPTGEVFASLYPQINECRKLTFVFTPSTIWLNNIITEFDTGDQKIMLRFENALNGIWRFRITSIDEKPITFHCWLPSAHLISEETYFLNSNPDTTITSPGNADAPLTVGNYSGETGNININSSRGYTRTNIINPNLAAPGTNILCPIPDNKYTQITGTGAAAAHSTGAIAMALEWGVVKGRYTSITGSNIKNLFIRGAYRSEKMEYPNKSWGYGALDVYGLFEKLI
ncbi:MAG: S8 family peptidase [Lachnospiraceae bacterium]|nr:S8 family peptidase [Lachnospiraceae bacterium]